MIALLVGLFLEFTAIPSHAELLPLEGFLSQVRAKNPSYQGAMKGKEGGLLRSHEGDLQTAFTFFVNSSVTRDAKVPQTAFGVYEATVTHNHQIGISKTWSFGLISKISYNLFGYEYVNPVTVNFSGVVIPYNYYNTFPLLELTFPLLANGFGRSVRAGQDLAEASALASHFGSSFQAKAVLTSAEGSYWRLSVARELKRIANSTLERTQKLFEWNARRVKMQLADRAELLQTQAGLEQGKLSVQAAADEVRSASLAFNSARNSDAPEVAEDLQPIDSQMIDRMEIPKRAERRDDVKAAEQSMKLTAANAKLSVEKVTPAVDLFANYQANGQTGYFPPSNFLTSAPLAFNFAKPTYTVGVRINAPLAFFTAADSRDGWRAEQTAAELNFDRKIYEQEQGWLELTLRFGEAKRRLAIARELENVQHEKLTHERSRYDRGRTTTFQLLSFETDYLNSQFQRLRNELELISTVAQMKLFLDDQN